MALSGYLKRAKRLSGTLFAWVRETLIKPDGVDTAAWVAIQDQAWQRHTQGDVSAAIGMLQNLIARVEASERTDTRSVQLLAGTLRVLTEVYQQAGQYTAALATAERELGLRRRLAQAKDIMNTLGTMADLLVRQQRYAEAETRYADAFYAAQLTGEPDLQGVLLKKQGVLKRRQNHRHQAIVLFAEAIDLFRRAGDWQQEMYAWDLLGTTQLQHGDLDAAETSYACGLELAEQRGDETQQAVVCHNLGILCQKRAEQTLEIDTQIALLQQAIALVDESLAIKLRMDNAVGAEASYFQLGILYWKLSELERAEHYLLQATALGESLNLPHVYKNYEVLSRFARSRGDKEAAARWQAKSEAKVAELQQRSHQGKNMAYNSNS